MQKKELRTLQEKEDNERVDLEDVMTSSTTEQLRGQSHAEGEQALCHGHHPCRRHPRKPTASQCILTPTRQRHSHPALFSPPGSLWNFIHGKGYTGMGPHFSSDCSSRHCLVLDMCYII